MKRSFTRVLAVSILGSGAALAACSSGGGNPAATSGGSAGTTQGSGGTVISMGGTAPMGGSTANTGGTTANTGGSSVTGGSGGALGSGGSAGSVAGTAGAPTSGGAGGVATTGGAAPGGASAGGSGGLAGGGGAPGGASGNGGTGGVAPAGGFVECPYTPPADPTGMNFAAGEVTLFNNNGAWTWYNDERVIVDKENGKIIVGSDANAQGPNGGGRDGAVEAVIYDVATGTPGPVAILGDLAPDDHNNAAFLIKPDGNYLAFWAGHNENCNSYWSNHNGTSWAAQQAFSWTSQGCPFTVNGQTRQITYNNLWNMTDENKIYNFVRAVGTSPNILVSDDNGMSWEWAGRLSSTPPVGYVAGYYKYWGNQKDRIDFLATEAHPRDNDNSLYHGYISGGKSYDTMGQEVDANIGDMNAPEVTEFTRIFATQTMIEGTNMHHAWNSDIMRYEDGTIAAIGMARTTTSTDDPEHAFLYFRFDGSAWSTTYLGPAGKKLYDSEQDYVGLGALHPDDPRVIYISAEHDPRTGEALPLHEIFQGVTCDEGATFQWTPITWNSTKDNLRPVVPAWDGNNMVLVWFRGTYSTAQIYNEEVVGIITQNPVAAP